MKNLTLRSKITVRWTTNPADMGYDGNPSDWLTAKGETMSLRKAAEFSIDKIVGNGVYHKIHMSHNGKQVSRDELRDVIYRAECPN